MARHRHISSIPREFGMALAVLSLWMLSLLAPLHQTAGLLRDLAASGHVLPAGWSVCVTLASDDDADSADGSTRATTVCPAQAFAKTELAAPAPDFVLASFRPAARVFQPQPQPRPVLARAPPQPVQARAPPSMI